MFYHKLLPQNCYLFLEKFQIYILQRQKIDSNNSTNLMIVKNYIKVEEF